MQVKLVPSTSAIIEAELDLYRRYQMCIHRDPPEKVTRKSFEGFLVRSPLKVIIVHHFDSIISSVFFFFVCSFLFFSSYLCVFVSSLHFTMFRSHMDPWYLSISLWQSISMPISYPHIFQISKNKIHKIATNKDQIGQY